MKNNTKSALQKILSKEDVRKVEKRVKPIQYLLVGLPYSGKTILAKDALSLAGRRI